LLEAGAANAAEKSELRSKIRRIKIACQRWRVDYQRMIENRYDETVEAVEERYLAEIRALQTELVTLRQKDGEITLALNTQARNEQGEKKNSIGKKRKKCCCCFVNFFFNLFFISFSSFLIFIIVTNTRSL
jgi:hypothetical protein